MKTESVIKEIKSDEFSDHYDRKKLLSGISRHSKLVIALTLLFSLFGAYGTYHYLTGKQASAILVYQPDETKTLPGGLPLNTPNFITQLELIMVPSNMQAVKTMLGIDESTKALQSQFEIPFPRVDSNLIKIIAKGDHPVEKVNALAKVAVKASQDYYKDQVKQALFNYKDQLQFAMQEQIKQLSEIEEFKKNNTFYDIDDKNSISLNKLLDLRKREQDANLAYTTLMVEYENLKRETLKPAFEEAQNSPETVYALRDRLVKVETALTDAKIRLAPTNPRISALENEYQRVKDELSKSDDQVQDSYVSPVAREKLSGDLLTMQAKVRSAQKNWEQLYQDLQETEKKMEGFPKIQIEFQKLMQDKKLIDDQIVFLNNAIDKTQLLLNSPKGALGIYQLADSADVLKDSWWVKYLPFIGAIFGFLTGVLFAFGIEMTDKYIRTLKQISLYYNIPGLIAIPEFKNINKKNSYDFLLLFLRDLSDRLDSILKKLSIPTNKFSITFLSTQNNEGRSLISYSLAKYYKEHLRKVIFLEFDTESISLLDGAEKKEASLIDVLRGKADWKEALIKGEVDALSVGKGDQYLKELIKSDAMDKLIKDLKDNYQVIVIDAPGLLYSDIGINLAYHADASLFLIGSEITEKSNVDLTLKQLDDKGIRPLGIVLNEVEPTYIEDKRVLNELTSAKAKYKGKTWLWK
ncbi:MAG: exopolysaccharide transport family protein [Parachlamydiaceae bacterium]